MQASSKLAAEASIMIRNQEQAYLHQIKAQTQQQTFLHQTEVQRQVVFEWKGRIALQAGHASPVKWCSKEKVLLGKWSAITMLELQHISLNEKVELLCKLAMGLTDFSPHSNIYLSPFSSSWPCLACQVVFEWKGRIALQAGHASPVKWCLKERFCEGNGQQLQCWSYNVYGLLGGHWSRGVAPAEGR